MNISLTDLERQLEAFGEHRIRMVAELAHEGAPDGIGPTLLLAMGSRETNLRNIAGDHGHGRGWMQIDDRFHAPWLQAHAGCRDDSWKATFKSALPAGRVPTLTAATLKAIDLLRANIAFGRSQGVPAPQIIRFACAAYNAGPGGALQGFRAGDVDLKTANGDYSEDVLERQDAVGRLLQRHALPV
jgi:hypothetical protein